MRLKLKVFQKNIGWENLLFLKKTEDFPQNKFDFIESTWTSRHQSWVPQSSNFLSRSHILMFEYDVANFIWLAFWPTLEKADDFSYGSLYGCVISRS